MADGVLSLSISVNEYRRTSVADLDLDSLSPSDIDTLAALTGVDYDWLKEIAQDGTIPCRKCGTPMKNHHPDDVPVCQACIRGDHDG